MRPARAINSRPSRERLDLRRFGAALVVGAVIDGALLALLYLHPWVR